MSKTFNARKADKVVINEDGTRTFYVKDFTIDGVQVETSAKVVWGGINSEVFNCGDHFEIREIFVAPIEETTTFNGVPCPKIDAIETQANILNGQSFQQAVIQKAKTSKKALDELKQLAGAPLSQYTTYKPAVSTAEIMFETYCSKYGPSHDYKKETYFAKVDTPLGEILLRDMIADIANHPKYAYEFAVYTEGRFEQAEKVIRKDVEYAVKYAIEFLDSRYEDEPELEMKILNSKYARQYLDWIVKNKPRWDIEKAIRDQHAPIIAELNAQRELDQMIRLVNIKPTQDFAATKYVGDLNEIINPDPLVQTIIGTLKIDETEAKRIADDMRSQSES
jgi:hypothetical protein